MNSILIIVMILCKCSLVLGRNESILILTLPQSINKPTINWTEILSGAQLAAKIINKDSGLLPLKLAVADSGRITNYDDSYPGNVLELITDLTRQNRSSDIIGIVGFLHPNVLTTLQKFRLPVISLVHFNGLPYNHKLIYMTASSSVLTDSVIAFMKAINHSRIGVVTELHHTSFFKLNTDNLQTKANNISVSLYAQVSHNYHNISSILHKIVNANIRVILLNADSSVSIQILCEALKQHLTWPKYAWILQSHSNYLNDVTTLKPNEKCTEWNITEGIFTFRLVPEEQDFEALHVAKACWDRQLDTGLYTGEETPFAYLLYKAVWALALAGNKSHIGVPSEFIPNYMDCSNVVYIYQQFNGAPNLIGIYDGQLNLSTNISETFSDTLPLVLREFPLGIVMVLPVMCLTLNTVLLVLYIYFHNEPSIKSTSVSLSLLIFLGCYLLIAYTIVLAVDESQHVKPFRLDLCMILIWLSGLGLSMPIIMATILVKMLRVYRIITLHAILKPRVYTTNCAHFVYTVLILSPNIIILLLWAAVDTYLNDIHYVEHSGYITFKEQCKSKYTAMWLILMLIYNILLSLAVVVVAIKSRKIRLEQFKDTKKVNLLIFLILFIGISTFSYWSIFTVVGVYGDVTTYILYSGHILLAFLCQVILFIPKIWPALHKLLLRKFVFRNGIKLNK